MGQKERTTVIYRRKLNRNNDVSPPKIGSTCVVLLFLIYIFIRYHNMVIRIEAETETTEEIRSEPSLVENRTRLLLSKHEDGPIQRVLDIQRMMAEFDPNGS
jgi:hypothetical protein